MGSAKDCTGSWLQWGLAAFIFVSTGSVCVLAVQEAVFVGAGDVAMVLLSYVVFLPLFRFADPDPHTKHFKALIGIGLIDVGANFLYAQALEMAGSSYFTVIYASLTALTAVLRRIALGRSITTIKGIAIFVVVGGLALTVETADAESEEVPKADVADSHLELGVMLALVVVFIMGIMYVSVEVVQARPDPPNEYTTTWVIGATEVVVAVANIVFTLVPNWKSRMPDKLHAAGMGWEVKDAMLLYLVIGLCTFFHMRSFYWIVNNAKDGCVLLGMLQGLRTAVTVVYGGFFLCKEQESQCFTKPKVAACFLVVFGVGVFVVSDAVSEWWAARGAKRDEERERLMGGQDIPAMAGQDDLF